MAVYGTNDALYGTGTFGSAVFGSLSPTRSVAGVSATISVTAVNAGGFEIDISENISTGVVGTGSIGSVGLGNSSSVAGVTSTVSIGQIIIDNFTILTGVVGTGEIGTVEPQTTEIMSGVSATVTVNTFTSVTGKANQTPTSVVGTGVIGTVTKTAVVFDFQAVKELYSRRRTILIDRAA
tara:strand:- start:1 stop:540 length:540 start_codon:yes stop_codon:yes gene_type:complete